VTVDEQTENSMVFDIVPSMVPPGLTAGDRLTLCLDPQWCRAFTVDSAP
jgi:hypothetical protein